MPQYLPHQPELASVFGNLKIRQDLINQCITIGIKNFTDWHVDTKEYKMSDEFIHFVEPDGELVGVKVFSLDKKPFIQAVAESAIVQSIGLEIDISLKNHEEHFSELESLCTEHYKNNEGQIDGSKILRYDLRINNKIIDLKSDPQLDENGTMILHSDWVKQLYPDR